MTDAEFQAAKAKAARAGIAFAELIRQAVRNYKPPKPMAHDEAVYATIHEYNKIATNLRQIAAATGDEVSTTAAASAERLAEAISGLTDGSFPPLSPSGLETVREHGKRINEEARAANSGKEVRSEALTDALLQISTAMRSG